MCASVDAEKISKDEIENPYKKDKAAIFNLIDISKKQVDDAILNPKEQDSNASANNLNCIKSLALTNLKNR